MSSVASPTWSARAVTDQPMKSPAVAVHGFCSSSEGNGRPVKSARPDSSMNQMAGRLCGAQVARTVQMCSHHPAPTPRRQRQDRPQKMLRLPLADRSNWDDYHRVAPAGGEMHASGSNEMRGDRQAARFASVSPKDILLFHGNPSRFGRRPTPQAAETEITEPYVFALTTHWRTNNGLRAAPRQSCSIERRIGKAGSRA